MNFFSNSFSLVQSVSEITKVEPGGIENQRVSFCEN
jgi:hypothetical protein